jgi:hypothetical protein
MWIWLWAFSCSEYSYTSKIQKDVFQQARRNTVDILLVVDDSCSMAEEQEKLSSNFESFISAFDGVDVDWQIAVTTTDTYRTAVPGQFKGGDDEVILVDSEGRSIDAVRWNRDWDFEEGAAMQLAVDKYSTTSNTSILNWCAARTEYTTDNLGTPGEANHLCANNQPPPPSEDTGDTVGTGDTGESGDTDTGNEPSSEPSGISPSVGDIIFTEMMIDPKGIPDADGEWIELTNLTNDTLDLSGFAIRDDGRNFFSFPEAVTLEPEGTLLVGRSDEISSNGGVSIDVVSENLSMANKVYVLKANQDDVQANFEEMVVVGTSGSGIEMGMEAAKQALSEPLLSNANQGFLREDANLSLIFISDEDDFSPQSAHSYLRFFTDLKGEEAYRNHSMLNVSAVVGKEIPPYDGEPSCVSENGVGFYGPKYIEMVNRTEGKIESICAEDFSPIASELGLVASGLQLEFALSDLPDLETLVVKLYSENNDDAFIGELQRGTDFIYVIESNAILFTPESLPDSETFILAEYRVLPRGAIITGDTGVSE